MSDEKILMKHHLSISFQDGAWTVEFPPQFVFTLVIKVLFNKTTLNLLPRSGPGFSNKNCLQ